MEKVVVEDCCVTQLIDANGNFNVEGLDNFMEKVKLINCGLSYAIVAIMGPQSSGKSTLLNHLFHTNFTEMDAYKGRFFLLLLLLIVLSYLFIYLFSS